MSLHFHDSVLQTFPSHRASQYFLMELNKNMHGCTCMTTHDSFVFSIGRPHACPSRKSYPDVLVVQSSQDWDGEDNARALDWSMQGRVFL